MSPKAPSSRLGPPPQLHTRIPPSQHQFTRNLQPKLRELAAKHIKLLAKWLHTQHGWKQVLLGWMVLLVASKMVMLALTHKYFTLTSLVSLQTFHAVWTLTFLVLTLHTSPTSLPVGSCLLAAYLPATTVLHILLIPRDFPVKYIITDTTTTLLAIMTMFLLLRMECGQILAETEGLWQQHKSPVSLAGTHTTEPSEDSQSPPVPRQVHRQTGISIPETVASPQYQQHPSMDGREAREINNTDRGFGEALDLEPIDFEHFMEEPDLERNHHLEKMFRVTYGEGPARGR